MKVDDEIDGKAKMEQGHPGPKPPRAQKSSDYAPKPEYMAFAEALRRHRPVSPYPTQARLGAALKVSWHAVGSWEKAIWAPAPEKVFELERLIDLPPGSLSRHLGYVPASGAHLSVLAAVDADPGLDAESKQLISSLYRKLARTPVRRT